MMRALQFCSQNECRYHFAQVAPWDSWSQVIPFHFRNVHLSFDFHFQPRVPATQALSSCKPHRLMDSTSELSIRPRPWRQTANLHRSNKLPPHTLR
jgi:hypothetical protein